jgi:hypothetical protein
MGLCASEQNGCKHSPNVRNLLQFLRECNFDATSSFLGSTSQLRLWPPPQNSAEFLGGFSKIFLQGRVVSPTPNPHLGGPDLCIYYPSQMLELCHIFDSFQLAILVPRTRRLHDTKSKHSSSYSVRFSVKTPPTLTKVPSWQVSWNKPRPICSQNSVIIWIRSPSNSSDTPYNRL